MFLVNFAVPPRTGWVDLNTFAKGDSTTAAVPPRTGNLTPCMDDKTALLWGAVLSGEREPGQRRERHHHEFDVLLDRDPIMQRMETYGHCRRLHSILCVGEGDVDSTLAGCAGMERCGRHPTKIIEQTRKNEGQKTAVNRYGSRRRECAVQNR